MSGHRVQTRADASRYQTLCLDSMSMSVARYATDAATPVAQTRTGSSPPSASCSPRARSTRRRSRRSPGGPASRARRSTSTSARGSGSSTGCARRSTRTRRSSPLRADESDVDAFDRAGRRVLGVARRRSSRQLYGVAAVDPAARDLVERQRRDRHGELRRLLGAHAGSGAFAALAVLTSFETFVELRRHVGLEQPEVTATLQAAAVRALSGP